MQEGWAYPALYQEHGNRATEDLSIMVLQGRSVGGGTTVNWTSSFRTPDRTLALWAQRHGVRGLDPGGPGGRISRPSKTGWSSAPAIRTT